MFPSCVAGRAYLAFTVRPGRRGAPRLRSLMEGRPRHGASSAAVGGLRLALVMAVIVAAGVQLDSGSGAPAVSAVTYADPAWSPDGKRIALIAQTSTPQSE